MSVEMEARYKKELKWLDQEKRAAMKKIKGTAGKGKKSKEQIAAAEAEYDAKIKALKERHAAERSAAGDGGGEDAASGENAVKTTAVTVDNNQSGQISAEEEERQRKQEKARRKREKAREKEREKERQIAEETAIAGPSPREVENKRILQHLEPLNLTIREVAADGHCLYRAIALQCSKNSDDYPEIRRLCADTLALHEDDFAPFCEYTDTIPDYSTYVERVRSSADWGGHLELRVLSMALKRPVWIYDAIGTKQPIVIDSEGGHESEPLRLSYHRQYYALGEHYNEVVPKDEAEA